MTPADLDMVVAHTRHERYRELTADDHPHREFYRRRVAERAAVLRGVPSPPTHTVPLRAARPRGSLAAAIAREH